VIFRLARPVAASGTVVRSQPLWAGFMRGSYSCSMADLQRKNGLNIFRRPVSKDKEKSLVFDFKDHSRPPAPPDWRELVALSSRPTVCNEQPAVCTSNSWPAHLVAGGVEALVMGAPAVRRWRSSGGNREVVSPTTGARK
jgi:hypothetical protein